MGGLRGRDKGPAGGAWYVGMAGAGWAGSVQRRVPSLGVAGAVSGPSSPSLSAAGLPRALPAPCLVCRGSLPPAGPCKRCRSFCAAVLQDASFVPLGDEPGSGLWTP